MTPTPPPSSQSAPRPVALITGGARRVGRAIALELARAGCDVIITCNHSTSEADATIREIVALGGSPEICRAEPLDLRNLEAVTRSADRLARELPRLDLLILNASSYDPTPLASLAHSHLTDAYAVNAASAALIAAHLAPRLSQSTLPFGGSIVAMCDIHALGEHGLPRSRNFLAYAMSKAALAELVRTLARELAPRVRVNGLAPGVVAWPESGPESETPAQQQYLQRVPLARAGTPQEAATAVRWLALDAAYITGQILRIDGGRTLL